jgi:hypothetical protein
MMGRLNRDQGQLFYCLNLEEIVPQDHQVRRIAGVLDLSWVHSELASRYSALGRPSIDPVLGTSNNDGFFVGSIAGVAHR